MLLKKPDDTSKILSLPNRLLSDHMVLQQGQPNNIWGLADPEQPITISVSWQNESHEIMANSAGHWSIALLPPAPGGPYTIKLNQGNKVIQIQDILCGEVWLASGQSNMEMPLLGGDFDFPIKDAKTHIDEAHFPQIRMFMVEKTVADHPCEEVNGSWRVASPVTVAAFSAVGYFFAREIYETLDVPVGIINASWSATAIESWSDPKTNQRLGIAHAYDAPDDLEPASPSSLYNGMIHPLHKYPIKGILWYQGESNIAWPKAYRRQFPALISDWRNLWGLGEIPFYFVQLAPFEYDEPEQMSHFREVQSQTFDEISNTGMVVTTDLGQLEDIHPVDKAPVGKRLAYWALANTYLRNDIPYTGPLVKKAERQGSHIRVYFEAGSLGGGLVFKGERGLEFELAGADEKWFQAQAQIDGQNLIVETNEVPVPIAIRFSWADNAQPNLFNKSGLPAIPFRVTLEKRLR
jgi:sialate O-acetylesterase